MRRDGEGCWGEGSSFNTEHSPHINECFCCHERNAGAVVFLPIKQFIPTVSVSPNYLNFILVHKKTQSTQQFIFLNMPRVSPRTDKELVTLFLKGDSVGGREIFPPFSLLF